MFENNTVDFELLRKRAFNLRWATVADGVIPLTAADPDFPCAPEIADAVAKFAKERYFSYGQTEGLSEFRAAMAGHFLVKRNINCNESLVLAVDSAAFGIYLTCKAVLATGDEAIVFDPVDFLFRYSIETVGAVAIAFPIPPGTEVVDWTGLEQLITPRTRMICLCNPLNPTGKVFTREELAALGEIAERNNLMILSDEIWSDIVFSPAKYTSIASVNELCRSRTITVTGFSKSYGLAGLRIGAVMAPDQNWFERLMTASLHRSTVHGANILSQVAATAALTQCSGWLNQFVFHLLKMRDLCVTELNAIQGIHCIAPDGCYVAFANITQTGKSSAEMRDLLMEKAKVAVVPGLAQWFGPGAEGYIRLSFATSETILTEALNRIKYTMS